MSEDHINNPPHYTKGKIEVIEFIEDQGLNFHLGNAIKYICRCRFKGSHIDDLKKAIWYLEREIKQVLTPNKPETRVVPKLNLPPDFNIEPGQISLVDEVTEFPPNIQMELPLEFKDTSKVGANKQPEHHISDCTYHGCYKCITLRSQENATQTK